MPDLSKWVTTSCSQWLPTIKDYISKIVCKTTINIWLFCILIFFPLLCCLLSFLLLSQSLLIVTLFATILPSSSHISTSRLPPFSHSQVPISVSYCICSDPSNFPFMPFYLWYFYMRTRQHNAPQRSSFFYMFQWSCFPPHFLFTPFTRNIVL